MTKLWRTWLFILFLLVSIQSCQDEASLDYKRYYVNGKGLYEKNCQGCHGGQGEGLGSLYPPLTDTTYLNTFRSQLACIIKNGQGGEIEINGVVYNGEMPANPSLTDIDVAQILVYITNSFGNKQGFKSLEAVSEDLRNCR